MRILAAIDQPEVIRGILECLGLSSRAPPLTILPYRTFSDPLMMLIPRSLPRRSAASQMGSPRGAPRLWEQPTRLRVLRPPCGRNPQRWGRPGWPASPEA
jgi:hypothetical protein